MNAIDMHSGLLPQGPDPIAPNEEQIGARSFRVPHVARLLAVARKRKWTIVATFVAAIVLGLVATMLMTPQYTASATIEIQRETQNFTNVEGAESDQTASIDQEFYQTQYGLLEARSLADRVAASLRLVDSVEFYELFGSESADEWFEDGRLRPGASTREQRVREAGDILLDNLSVSPERLSRLVEIKFTSPDPAFSKRVVDAWGQHFIQATLERRFEATSYARKFLEDRLAQLRTRIDASERTLVDYAGRQGIVNLPGSTGTGDDAGQPRERSLVADDLATLNRELARATADRVAAQSRLGASGGEVNEALQNQGISDMRAQRADVAAQYARMLQQFEPGYPPAQALQAQLTQLDRSIAREETRVRSSLQETYTASRNREQQLAERVEQLKSGLLDLRRRSIQYNIFQRDADTNRQLYDALLQRYKEIGVAGGVGVNNISVVDQAELPKKPSSPRPLLNMALALAAAFIFAIGLLFVLEQIDEAIADPAELNGSLDVALLGTIPKSGEDNPVVALEDPKNSLSEAYFSLQTNLALATTHGLPRTVAVTSSRPGEGKTTTAFAIARTLARLGKRVALVDADMRSPSIHHLLNLENGVGLSNYLAGGTSLDAMVRTTNRPDLFTITAGPQPPSAAELLSSEAFNRLLQELMASFDHVVFDAPPVMGLADAPVIGSKVEGTIFVVEAHATKKSVARVAVERLRAARSSLTGAVLTKFDVKRAHYGYGYDYGYGYGYGTTEKA